MICDGCKKVIEKERFVQITDFIGQHGITVVLFFCNFVCLFNGLFSKKQENENEN